MPITLYIIWGVYLFLMGAAVGSFLNVVIARMPFEESIVTPRSKCPGCGTPIRAYDNIPVLSYILLGAKCRDCGERISIRYPLVELLTAFLFLGLYWKLGLTPALAVFCIFCSAMVAVFFIDLDHMIIPDPISLNLIPIGMIAAILGLIPGMDWKSSLIGFFLGGAVLYVPAQIYLLLRGVEGLGGGDVKLLAMMGAFLGPYGVVFVLLVSSLTGSVIGILGILFGKTGSTTPIPYGPFIAFAGVLYLFVGPEVIQALFGAAALQTSVTPGGAPIRY
jgi:leader peptidase (prepilin peptidase)/N-methyltransferase